MPFGSTPGTLGSTPGSLEPGSLGSSGIFGPGIIAYPPSPSGLLAQFYAPVQRPALLVLVGGQYRGVTGLSSPSASKDYVKVEWFTDGTHPYAWVRCTEAETDLGIDDSGSIAPATAQCKVAERVDEATVLEIETRGNIPMIVFMGYYDGQVYWVTPTFTGYVRSDRQRYWPYTDDLQGLGAGGWRLSLSLATTVKLKTQPEWQVHRALYQASGVKGWDLDGSDLQVLSDPDAPYYAMRGRSPSSVASELDGLFKFLTGDHRLGHLVRRAAPSLAPTGIGVQVNDGTGGIAAGWSALTTLEIEKSRDQGRFFNSVKVLGKRPTKVDKNRPHKGLRFASNLVPSPPDYFELPPVESDWLDSSDLVNDCADKTLRLASRYPKNLDLTFLGCPLLEPFMWATLDLPSVGIPANSTGAIYRVRNSFGGLGYRTIASVQVGLGRSGDDYALVPSAVLEMETHPGDPDVGLTRIHLKGKRSRDPDGPDGAAYPDGSDLGVTHHFWNSTNAQTSSGKGDGFNEVDFVMSDAEMGQLDNGFLANRVYYKAEDDDGLVSDTLELSY